MKKPLPIQLLLSTLFLYFFSIAVWTVIAQWQIYQTFGDTDFFVKNLLTAVPLQLLVILLPSIIIFIAVYKKSLKLRRAFFVVQIIQFLLYLPIFVLLFRYVFENIRGLLMLSAFYLPGIAAMILALHPLSRDYLGSGNK